MSDSIKEILFDKAVDNILDLIADTSKGRIADSLNKDMQQKILYKTFVNFSKSLYFKNELKNINYIDDKVAVFSLKAEKISASKTNDEIAEAILPVVNQCFITDDQSVLNNIAKYISIMYLERAKITIQLYDVVDSLHQGFFQLSDDLSYVKNIVLSNYNHEMQLKAEKESLFKKELRNEAISIISEIINHYLYFILKHSPSYSQEEMKDLCTSMANKLEITVCNISDYINEDFCTIPVTVTKINGLESSTEAVNYFVYSELYFRNLILENTRKLLYYKDIIDLETYVIILKLRDKIQGNLFPPLIKLKQTNILANRNIKINVKDFREELSSIGELIYNLYEKLI